MSIATALQRVKTAIQLINNDKILSSASPVILAASKTQPVAVIEAAITAGILDFGENRVQEAEEKWPALRVSYPQVRLHLIGPLQTNKVKQAVALFDVIQTVDRQKLAEALAEEMKNTDKKPACYIQVNTGCEPQKAGVLPEEADALIAYCLETVQLPVVGLMCIPPNDQPPAPHFALLRQIALRHGLTELSMGMSDDYETAVRMGSTCIRLGRVLFGERAS